VRASEPVGDERVVDGEEAEHAPEGVRSVGLEVLLGEHQQSLAREYSSQRSICMK